jgi:hypothetical protein
MPQVTPLRYFNISSTNIKFKETFLSFYPIKMKLSAALLRITKYNIVIKKLDRTLSFPFLRLGNQEIPQYTFARSTDCPHCPCVCSDDEYGLSLIKIFGFNPDLDIPQELSRFYILHGYGESYKLSNDKSFSIVFSVDPYYSYTYPPFSYYIYYYGSVKYLSIKWNTDSGDRTVKQLLLCTKLPNGNIIYFSPSLSPSGDFLPAGSAVSSIYATVQTVNCGCPKGYIANKYYIPASVTVQISEGLFQGAWSLYFSQRYSYSHIDFIRNFPCLWLQITSIAPRESFAVLFWSETPEASGAGVYNFYLSDSRTNWQVTFIASFDAKTGTAVIINPIVGTNKVFLNRSPCRKIDQCQNDPPYFACGCPPGYSYTSSIEPTLKIDNGPLKGYYYLFFADTKSSQIIPYGVTADPYSIDDIDKLRSLCFWYTEAYNGYFILVWKKTYDENGIYELYFNDTLLGVFDVKTLETLYITPASGVNDQSEIHLLFPPCYKNYYRTDVDSDKLFDNPSVPVP